MKKIILAIVVAFLGIIGASAQGTIYSGCVNDTDGQAIPGAAIVVDGASNIGVVTDIDGKYSIAVPDAKGEMSLVISCLGYKTQSVLLGKKTKMDFILEEDRELLDEVVVVGYGAMRRSDLTGSVSSVRIDEDNAARSSTLDQILDGKAAGVQVLSESGSPDAGVTIRIRGISSFTGNTDPLYVVDGVIVEGSSESIKIASVGTSGNSSNEKVNGLAGLNPQDIASIEILKDASATAIYGSQGANGVVLITTKNAGSETPVINFSAGVSVGHASNRIDVLSFDEYVGMLSASNSSSAEKYLSIIYDDPATKTGLKVQPMDWQDYIFRTSVSQRYYFSVAASPKGYNYLFSLGYNHVEGILKNSDSDNFTARINLEKNILHNLKVSFKTGFGYTFTDLVTGIVNGGNPTSRSSIIRSALRTRPYTFFPGQDDQGEEYDEGADDDTNFGPKRFLEGTTNTSKRFRINPSLRVDWKIADWVSFKSIFGADFSTNERIKTKIARLSVGYGNLAGIGNSKSLKYNWDNLINLTYKKSRHRINGTLGFTMSMNSAKVQSVTGYNLPQANARETDINTALPEYSNIEGFSLSQSSLMSAYARAIYNYAERYIVTATVRADGSSKFISAKKWGVFPSFAAAWRISNESWFNAPVISNFKLRLGWGQVGNQAISNYQTSTTYTSLNLGNHFTSSGKETTLYPSNISNPFLTWETSNQLNGGLDISFWKGRLALTVDAYDKVTVNLLQQKAIPISNGYSTMAINDGSIRNYGGEFTIDAVPVKLGHFEWSIGGNISINRNIIRSVGESGNSATLYLDANSKPVQCNYFYGSTLQSSGDQNPLNIFIEGQPMGLFYGYVTNGIVQEDGKGLGPNSYYDESGNLQGGRPAGYIQYKDLDGDGKLTVNDRTIIGNPLPKFTYGISTAFSWKDLCLKIDLSGSYGAQIFNMNNIQDYDTTVSKNMRRDAFYCAWSEEHPENTFPSMDATNDPYLSDRYVEDGSYLRISNISLSYAVPFNKRTSRILHGLTLALSCSNVYIWSEYSGYSPLCNAYGTNVKKMGVDLNTAPFPRTYNFDIKFSF